MLFNSQAWCNLSKKDLNTLRIVQLKFLKRIFYAPQSTSNSITFLETGTLPIEYEINKRQLNFLHHILNLEENDPVKKVYYEQLKYIDEKNWGNEVLKLRAKYNIPDTDPEIAEYSKDHWKSIVKRRIKTYALGILNREMSMQKHGCQMDQYHKLETQQYLKDLQPQKARKLFHVRAGILDVKTVRKYWYNDSVCRLCQQNDETVNHIVNECTLISRTSGVIEVFTNNIVEMEQIADRCIQFANKTKEMESTGER